MTEFSIHLYEKEDGSIYALMKNEGFQAAIVSEPLNGDKSTNLMKVRNLFSNLGQSFMERCLPDIAPVYKKVTLPDGTTLAKLP